MTNLRAFARTEGGQDLLEYAMLASLIALFALGAVKLLGEHMYNFYWQGIGNAV